MGESRRWWRHRSTSRTSARRRPSIATCSGWRSSARRRAGTSSSGWGAASCWSSTPGPRSRARRSRRTGPRGPGTSPGDPARVAGRLARAARSPRGRRREGGRMAPRGDLDLLPRPVGQLGRTPDAGALGIGIRLVGGIPPASDPSLCCRSPGGGAPAAGSARIDARSRGHPLTRPRTNIGGRTRWRGNESKGPGTVGAKPGVDPPSWRDWVDPRRAGWLRPLLLFVPATILARLLARPGPGCSCSRPRRSSRWRA